MRKLKRFHSIKRGYWSFLILGAAFAISLVGPLVVGSRALVVIHDGKLHLPALPFSAKNSGQDFGLAQDKDEQEYTYEVDYRELKAHFEDTGKGFMLMPFIPYNPNENDFREGSPIQLRLTGNNGTCSAPTDRAGRSRSFILWVSNYDAICVSFCLDGLPNRSGCRLCHGIFWWLDGLVGTTRR